MITQCFRFVTVMMAQMWSILDHFILVTDGFGVSISFGTIVVSLTVMIIIYWRLFRCG